MSLLAAGALLLSAGCASLSKEKLEERLLALDKNAPVREAGLSRLGIEMELDGERIPLELTYLHVPSATPVPPSRRPVVLVHGTPSTLCTWVETIFGTDGFAGFAAHRDVYAIEIPGHGVARGDLSPYTFERCARFVAAAIRGLGLDDVHLVGSSYGGEFVWRAALNEPDLVRSLVLVDSSGLERRDGDFLPEEVEMRENGLAGWGYLINSRDRIETALAPHFDGIPPDRTEEFFLVCDNAHNWRAMVDLARDENGTREGELDQISCPTLVLWGSDDFAYAPDYYAERFAAAIPRARLQLMGDTGHYPHEQRPAEFVRALETFFVEQER